MVHFCNILPAGSKLIESGRDSAPPPLPLIPVPAPPLFICRPSSPPYGDPPLRPARTDEPSRRRFSTARPSPPPPRGEKGNGGGDGPRRPRAKRCRPPQPRLEALCRGAPRGCCRGGGHWRGCRPGEAAAGGCAFAGPTHPLARRLDCLPQSRAAVVRPCQAASETGAGPTGCGLTA